MGTEDLELVRFAMIPTLDVAATVAMATEVLARVPDAPAAGVRKAARRLRDSLEALRAGWHAQEPAPRSEQERRAADRATDNAWAALQRRLASYAQLPVALYPDAARAAEIGALLFSDGLRFLTLPWKSQWAEGDKRLQQIEERKLAEDIDRIAWSPFLAEVRRTHEAYGKVLGIAEPLPESPSPIPVAEPLLALRRALKRYALQVIATADEDSPASVEAVVRALSPIEEARTLRARAAPLAEGEPTPASPTGESSPRPPSS
jgi:hypothetical protein